MVSLLIQQLYREILTVADENGGSLKNRVMFYCDEFGSLPPISSAEVMYSASRSRKLSIVSIIQSYQQLEKNYGKEGASIIQDNCQLTIAGGFAPTSETADIISKALGTRTVMTGSVSRGHENASQSLQMTERPLSNGEQTKLMLAVLFLKENNFLLIDEPTNHLDIQGRELVSRYLNSKKGFILVSHDRAFLDGCVDHILSINKANIEVCRGNFSTWYENKQRQDAFEQAENDKLKREIRRLEETAKEKADWSDTAESRKLRRNPMEVDNVKGWRPLQGAKAKKSMARSKAIEKRQQAAIEEKSKLLKNIERSDSLKIFQTPFHTKRLVSLRDVAICYGQAPVCEGITFEIQQGDRIALQGANGSGKSSIIKLICGQDMSGSENRLRNG